MTRIRRAALLASFGLLSLSGSVAAQTAAPKTLVEVDGHKLNVRLLGTAKPGMPTVVFESGLGSPPFDSWGSVRSDVAATTRTVAYERAGIGASEPGPEPRSIKQIVAELHALLAKLEVPPPYVFVGHSYGGPIIHSFAATYPKEVAGLSTRPEWKTDAGAKEEVITGLNWIPRRAYTLDGGDASSGRLIC